MVIKDKILTLISLTFVLSIFFLAHSPASEAQSTKEKAEKSATQKKKVKKRKKDSGQSARVKIDGAAVYEGPNFDSPVLEYLDSDKKVLISKKLYAGVGGMGAFYKMKIRNGVYGFITDTDVEIKKRSSDGDDGDDEIDDAEEAAVEKKKKDEATEDSGDPTVLLPENDEDENEPAFADSLYMTRFIGLAYASYNYAEKLRNTTETTTVGMFGLNYSGPTQLVGGMPMDLNFILTTTAPDFYDKIATSTSGYMLIGDALIMMPLYESKNFMFFYGVGLVLRYSAWDVALRKQAGKPAIDSQEIAIGAAAEAGAAVRVAGKFLVRGQAKYYYEKEKYFGYGAAVQYQF